MENKVKKVRRKRMQEIQCSDLILIVQIAGLRAQVDEN